MSADKHWKTSKYTVPGNARKRDVNVDRQETSVYLDSPELTVPENTRKFFQTQEDIRKRSIFLHSRTFAVRENARKLL